MFFKKKPETPPAEPVVFESDKERQFRDPKTGEFVYQRVISPEARQAILGAMNENGHLAQKFIQITRQSMAVKGEQNKAHDAIVASEKEINDLIEKTRDDMKLDRRWVFNMQLGVLERRDPPA